MSRQQRCSVALTSAAFIVVCLLSPSAGVQAADLYWMDYGRNGSVLFSLQRVRLGRSRPSCHAEVIRDIGQQPSYADLVATGGKVYWRDFYGQLVEARRDGTGIGPAQVPSTKVGFQLIGADLDAAGVYSYWPYAEPGVIRRGDFEGENQVDLLYTRPFQPNMSIALDDAAGRIYWAGAWSGGDTGIVQRANLDGTVIETLVGSGLYMDDYPVDIALDLVRGKVYWTNMPNRKIQRANLDGSNVEDVVTDVMPFSIAIDADGGKCRKARKRGK